MRKKTIAACELLFINTIVVAAAALVVAVAAYDRAADRNENAY